MISIIIPNTCKKDICRVIENIFKYIHFDIEIIILQVNTEHSLFFEDQTIKIITENSIGKAFTEAVKLSNYENICFFPCSCNINIRNILKLYNAFSTDADVVFSRIKPSRSPLPEKFFYYAYVTFVHFYLWIPYFEAGNPFIFKKKILKNVIITSKSDFFIYEFIYTVLKKRFKIREINIYGKELQNFKRFSKINYMDLFKDIACFKIRSILLRNYWQSISKNSFFRWN